MKVPDSALRSELRDLYEDYAAALDEMRLEEWTGFFAEGALYRVMARETFEQGLTHATIYCDGLPMIRDRAASIRNTSVYEPRSLRHFISGVRVTSTARGEIAARANFLIVECKYDREPQVLMVGEYLDRLVSAPGGLRFKERTAIYDNYRVGTTLVIPV
jgi:anthranilate 1,2-dioxygenase small subunit